MPKKLTERFFCSARATILSLFSLVFVLSTAACGGNDGTSCTVTDNGDGSATITCTDGTSATVNNGQDGNSCTVTDNGDGTKTISCDDGTTVNVDNGQDGNDGQDGSTTLVVNEILPDGDPNCPNGGIAVNTGIDSDGNGLLEGDEIASTSYLCNGQDGEGSIPTGILQGSYTIRNSLDTDWLSSVTTITGELVVDAPGMTSLSLPALTSVGGDMKIENNDTLTSFDLSALTSVGGRLSISGNAALPSFDLSALTSVGWTLIIYNNAALTSLGLSALTSVGGDLIIRDNSVLTSMDLPALTTVGGDLHILSNIALTNFDLSALTSAGGDLYIESNPALCNSLAIALRDQLIAAGWNGTANISGNDDSC